MTRRNWLAPILWLFLPGVFLCGAAGSLRPDNWRPHTQAELLTHTVYAYRQWQSTGIQLELGDRVEVWADGHWLYSPAVGLHDAWGGRPAPATYPLGGSAGGARGGALIGRMGDDGAPFLLGRHAVVNADAAGLLYVRINDDLLGDNAGQLVLTIARLPAPDSPAR